MCHNYLMKVRDLWWIAAFMIAAVLFWLLYAVWKSPHRSDLENFGAFAVPVIGGAVAAVKLVLSLRDKARTSIAAVGTDRNVLVDQLAEAVEEQWEEEASKRGLLSPEPIPVKWRRPLLPLTGPVEAAVGTRLFNPLPGLEAITPSQLMTGEINDLYAIYGGLGSGRLVIVGAAGAGKTGAAVLLLLKALQCRKQTPEADRAQIPVPVLFTVHGWDPSRQPIQKWLVTRIQQTYRLFSGEKNTPNAEAVVAAGGIALILDGLDEMAKELRHIALQALSQQTLFRVVVMTRTPELLETSQKEILEAAAAIELQDIDSTSAADYLIRVQRDPPLDGWRKLTDYIRERPESSLARALSTPLTLTLIRDTYREDDDARELLEFCGIGHTRAFDGREVDEIVDHLLGRVLRAAYKFRPTDGKSLYDFETANLALTSIAKQMNRDHTRDLAPVLLLRWAPVSRYIIYAIASGIGTAVMVGVMAWLINDVGSGIAAGTTSGIVYGTFIGFETWLLESGYFQRRRHARFQIPKGPTRRRRAVWILRSPNLLNPLIEFMIAVLMSWIVFDSTFGASIAIRIS
jgi:hypothetical protein